jgi:hypothetical protein
LDTYYFLFFILLRTLYLGFRQTVRGVILQLSSWPVCCLEGRGHGYCCIQRSRGQGLYSDVPPLSRLVSKSSSLVSRLFKVWDCNRSSLSFTPPRRHKANPSRAAKADRATCPYASVTDVTDHPLISAPIFSKRKGHESRVQTGDRGTMYFLDKLGYLAREWVAVTCARLRRSESGKRGAGPAGMEWGRLEPEETTRNSRRRTRPWPRLRREERLEPEQEVAATNEVPGAKASV